MNGHELGPGWTKFKLLFPLSSVVFKHSWYARFGSPAKVMGCAHNVVFAAFIRFVIVMNWLL